MFFKWLKNEIKPFSIAKYDNGIYSVSLSQNDYWYDWVQEAKVEHIYHGDGHCYNYAFKDYLGTKCELLNKRLDYDSENGMFCVYCNDIKDAEEVSYELSSLYKNENKMIELIKNIKEKYGFRFDVDIDI